MMIGHNIWHKRRPNSNRKAIKFVPFIYGKSVLFGVHGQTKWRTYTTKTNRRWSTILWNFNQPTQRVAGEEAHFCFLPETIQSQTYLQSNLNADETKVESTETLHRICIKMLLLLNWGLVRSG